jgi:hypothetical protein
MVDLKCLATFGCVGHTVTSADIDVDGCEAQAVKVTSLLLAKCMFSPA